VEDVVREVKECILQVSPGGGHIISSSNTIHSGVLSENYRVMLETIKEYGVYPIDTERIEKELIFSKI
jgi:uroporphyrinogen decarboxylase